MSIPIDLGLPLEFSFLSDGSGAEAFSLPVPNPVTEGIGVDFTFITDGSGQTLFVDPATFSGPRGVDVIVQYNLDIDPEIGLDPNGEFGDNYTLYSNELPSPTYFVANVTRNSIVFQTENYAVAVAVLDALDYKFIEASFLGSIDPDPGSTLLPNIDLSFSVTSIDPNNVGSILNGWVTELNNTNVILSVINNNFTTIAERIQVIKELCEDRTRGVIVKHSKNVDRYERAKLVTSLKNLGLFDQFKREIILPTNLNEGS